MKKILENLTHPVSLVIIAVILFVLLVRCDKKEQLPDNYITHIIDSTKLAENNKLGDSIQHLRDSTSLVIDSLTLIKQKSITRWRTSIDTFKVYGGLENCADALCEAEQAIIDCEKSDSAKADQLKNDIYQIGILQNDTSLLRRECKYWIKNSEYFEEEIKSINKKRSIDKWIYGVGGAMIATVVIETLKSFSK